MPAVSEQSARYNLRTAAQDVRDRLGLTAPASEWTYEQRIIYNRTLAAHIQNYPQSFTPAVLEIAAGVQQSTNAPLESVSFDWGTFAADTLDNAPGVLNGFTNKLILGVVVVAVVYFAVKAYSARPVAAA